MNLHATAGLSGRSPRWVVELLATLLAAAVAAAEEPRILFIAIDAVPFETMLEASHRPENTYYQSLAGPVPLISTFPSTTSLGFLMSDVEGWQPDGAVRFDQALAPFLD